MGQFTKAIKPKGRSKPAKLHQYKHRPASYSDLYAISSYAISLVKSCMRNFIYSVSVIDKA